MGKPHGIIVFGASGSGTTTLGIELARELDFSHFDLDDYFWQDSDIPFTSIRPLKERAQLLQAAIADCRGFVLSGSMCDWSDTFIPLFDLAVFVTAPTDIRLERLQKRELERFGQRINEGGDMYEIHREFIEWAGTYDTGSFQGRSLALHEKWLGTLPCPVIRVDGMVDCRQTAGDIATRLYTKAGVPWRVSIAKSGELKAYRFTVIFARYQDKWLYARHKDRDTYEAAGGHIEPGETPLQCAKRELFEETGAIKFFIHPAFDYSVHTNTEFSYGQVFYADIETLGEIPQDSEMAEVRGLHTIPDKMTYPAVLPALFSEMRKWLGLDKAETEYWDILDENRNPTGRTHKRGDIMQPGDFHLVVNAWIVNSRGELLITRRAFNKIGFPGMWEIPSGSATADEDSLAAAIREAGEECGIVLQPENAELFSTYRRSRGAFHDNWLFRQDFELSEVVLQEGETIDARAATWDEISAMMERGEFIEREVFPAFDLLEGMS